ncbi:hypothetical protein RJ641_015612 [Dillenia turbinata]|uniref:Uncharacterized protein n=1 Tax=Dillenia turbinata TaxID=194707 RepID=A0AAN8V1J7_9MAGN
MSDIGKHLDDLTIRSLSNRFYDSVTCEINKPDFKELDLGSPISPLPTRVSSASATSSSSSSSSLSGKTSSIPVAKTPNGSLRNHSGELSAASAAPRSASNTRNSKPGHRRSNSASYPLIYSGSTLTSASGSATNPTSQSISSANMNLLPSGNICPSGKIFKTGFAAKSSPRPETLGSGTGNYGRGSIMRGGCGGGGGGGGGKMMGTSDPEEVKKVGNEMYKRGNFVEALSMYDKAISVSPENAAYRSNRAAALTALGRLGEAVRECEEALRLDPGYGRAHQRLGGLFLRLGQVENARCHLSYSAQQSDSADLWKLRCIEKHLIQCSDSRKIGDWKSALRECDAAIVAGAESSPQLLACKAEAFLKLQQLEEAESNMSKVHNLESYPVSCSQTKFFGMLFEVYILYVRAQIEMALGRFDSAAAAAEKAAFIDYGNIEVAILLNNVKMVARARACGNDLFSLGKFAEASSAYSEGLKYDSSNSVLFCNRAASWFKLGLWEQSVEDCNRALKIQPNYTKALLRRAASNGKLERWAEAIKDYEILARELPGDNDVAESLLNAQVALKKLCKGEIQDIKLGGQIEKLSGLDRFKVAISSPGHVCLLKVDVEESPAIAKAERA